jgi:RNA polymerase sigma factor (sigma-70 family)
VEARLNFVPHPSFDKPDAEKTIFAVQVRVISAAWFIPWMNRMVDEQPAPHESPWSRKEEQAIFLQFNYARKQAAEHPRSRRWADEVKRLHNQIAEANLGLVCMMVSKYLPMDGDRDGTISEAQIALHRAIDKFDVRKNNKFSTYAVAALFRALARHHRKVSKELKRFAPFSPSQEQPVRQDFQEEALDHLRLVLARADLSDVERFIIQERFLTDTPKTLEEIGRSMTPVRSKERVRQIEARVLAKLRELYEAA